MSAFTDRRSLSLLRRRLLRRAVMVLDDPDLAEDACQETLLRVLQSVATGRCPPTSSTRYSFGVLRNVLRETLRDRANRRAAPASPPAHLPDPLSVLERRRLLGRVEVALGRLSAQHRDVLTLTLVGGLSSSEVSRRTGLPAATVRKRKHRALARLRKLAANDRRGTPDRSAP